MPFRVTKLGSRTISRDEAIDRLKEAVQAYEEGEGLLCILQAARLYVISKTTLYPHSLSYVTIKILDQEQFLA